MQGRTSDMFYSNREARIANKVKKNLWKGNDNKAKKEKKYGNRVR